MSSVTAPFLSSIILTIVFAIMWRNHRERWLGFWAFAAALWTTRYFVALLAGDYHYVPGAQLLPVFALGRGCFLLMGAYALSGRRLALPWPLLFAADAALIVGEWWAGDLMLGGARGVPHYLLFGAATIWSAGIVFRSRRTLGNEAVLVAICLTLIGISNATFPWTSEMPLQVAPALFMLAHAAQLGVGFGAMMIFYRRASAERDHALERLEDALAKALTGYLPICAHCKAIRGDDGEWESLEQYLSPRIDAALSHGICPTCAEVHYGYLDEAPTASTAMGASA